MPTPIASSLTAAQPLDAPSASGLKKWLPLIIMSLAFMIIILDTTILNVSLRAIITDLHTTIQNFQWVITGYSLTLAALTITGGRLGDIFGRKKMFVIGAIIFAVGSFITSISQSVGVMIAGEAIIEGIGAALMVPATSSLLVANYKGRDRQLAMGVWGGIAGGAAALGPVVGGWLTTNFSWRWAFRINIFVAILLVIGSFFMKESQDREEKPTLDYLGIVLSALGLLSLVFGFIEASTYGWLLAKMPFVIGGYTLPLAGLSITPVAIVIGILILALFLLWEYMYQKRGNAPLVSLKLFENSQFTLSIAIMLILSLGQAGMSFSIPVFLQSVLGINPLNTGFAMLPMSLTLLVVAPLSAYIAKYFTPKRILQTGLLLDAIAFFVMRSSVSVHANQWSIAPGFALFGLGMGLMMAQASNMTLSAVSVEEAGEASGVNSTLRQVGATFGSAIMGSVLLSVLSAGLVSGVNASTIIPDAAKPAIVETVTTNTSAIEFGTEPEGNSAPIPAPIKEEITSISHQATVDGNRVALLFGVFFALAAFALSFKLPNTKNIEREQSVAAGH